MRVLYVAAGMPIPGTHGGSVHAMQLCRALARAGHEIHLAALEGEQGLAAAADLEGLHMRRLRRAPLAQLEFIAAAQVQRIAEAVRPDVLVERFYTFGGSGLLAARRLGIPAVLEVNSPARTYPGSWRDRLDAVTLVRPIDRWRRWQLRAAVGFYATSAVLLPEPLQAQVTVIVNGVDCDRIQPGSPAPDEGPLRCIYVSSFRAWHGAVDLAAAIGECAQRGVEIHLTCLGEGPTLESARQAAAAGGVQDRIDFVGRVPHDAVPGYLANAHVGVAPFNPAAHRALELGWFWSPIKIFEYLAAGLPVVTADIDELRALLPDSLGRFYAPGDVGALADRLVALATDRDAVRAAGLVARRVAEKHYTWDEQAARVGAVLERAIGLIGEQAVVKV